MADRTDLTHRSTGRVTLGEFVRRELPISTSRRSRSRNPSSPATTSSPRRRTSTPPGQPCSSSRRSRPTTPSSVSWCSRPQARPTATLDAPTPSASPGRWQPGPWSGGAIGALVGALLIGGATALFASGSTALVAALSGAFFGGVAGAIWVVFAKMGGSDAYRQSFVAPELTDVCIVSLHTDDAQEAADARDRLAARSLAHDRRRRQQRNAHPQSAMTTTRADKAFSIPQPCLHRPHG